MLNIGFTNTFHNRDQIGLHSANQKDSETFMKDDTLFLAGTSNLQDVRDDSTNSIPSNKLSQTISGR